MNLAIGVVIGFVLAAIGQGVPRLRGTVLHVSTTPGVRARIMRMQELGENSLAKTISNALAVYETCLKVLLRNGTVWVHEVDGTQQQMEIK